MKSRSLLTSFATLIALTAAPAMAADMRMPVKAPPPIAAPVFSWTGCYVGAHGGYGWGTKKWSDPFGDITEHDIDGWLVGGQLGCNIQNDRWVFGIEGQASWADFDGRSRLDPGPAPVAVDYFSKTDIVGSIALRLGYAVDRTLFYVKGGAAFAHDKHWEEFVTPLFAGTNVSEKHLRWGWMAGGGFEYAFTGNWSGKIEYNYMDFGRKDVQFCLEGGSGSCFDYSIKQHIHVVKAGINYRFGGFGGPVVARY
jgi:outer membrane immunogenic protein